MLARRSGWADGDSHCAIACSFGNLANAHGGLGDPGTARGMLPRALSSKESHYGAECYAVAISPVDLANSYDDLGGPGSERDVLQRALGIQEAH